MGETLGIAHNVFEKMEREKDRKERMKKYEEWQKEQEKRKQRLRDIQAKVKEAERFGGFTPDSQSPLVCRRGASSSSSLIDQDQDIEKKEFQGRKYEVGRSDKKSSHQNNTLQEISGTSPKRKMEQRTSSTFSRMWQKASLSAARRCESQDLVVTDSTETLNDSDTLVERKHYLKTELRPWSKSVAELTFKTSTDSNDQNEMNHHKCSPVRKASDYNDIQLDNNAKTLREKFHSTPGLSSEDHHECRPTEGHIIINFDMTETKKKVSEEKFSRQISSMSLKYSKSPIPANNSSEHFMEEGMNEKDTKNFIFYEREEHPSRCGQCILL